MYKLAAIDMSLVEMAVELRENSMAVIQSITVGDLKLLKCTP
jgi:hypothetical protein